MITKLFTPMKVGNCTIPNRLVVPAMVTNYCDEDGFLTDRYMAYIEEKAKGGWGMIITEDYSVTPHGKGYQYIPGFYKDEHVALNKELTRVYMNMVLRSSVKCIIQEDKAHMRLMVMFNH